MNSKWVKFLTVTAAASAVLGASALIAGCADDGQTEEPQGHSVTFVADGVVVAGMDADFHTKEGLRHESVLAFCPAAGTGPFGTPGREGRRYHSALCPGGQEDKDGLSYCFGPRGGVRPVCHAQRTGPDEKLCARAGRAARPGRRRLFSDRRSPCRGRPHRISGRVCGVKCPPPRRR